MVLSRDRKILFWSRGARELTGYTEDEILNKACSQNCLQIKGLENLKVCSKQCVVHRILDYGETAEEDIYFLHKEGHRLPLHISLLPWRRESKGPAAGVIEIFRDASASARYKEEIEELKKLALLDPLTESGNRRFCDMRLTSQIEELRRYNTPFGVIFFDADRFKDINDAHGHEAGDSVLRMLARTFRLNLRVFDTVARWGGDEFMAIVVNVNAAQLADLAEKLRVLAAESSVRLGRELLRTTVSSGATLARKDDSPGTLVARADAAMYESKKMGGNRVTQV